MGPVDPTDIKAHAVHSRQISPGAISGIVVGGVVLLVVLGAVYIAMRKRHRDSSTMI